METISSNTPKARKVHRCDSCFKSIIIGETYYNSFVVDGGQSWTWKEHSICHRVSNLLYKHGFHGDELDSTPPIDYFEGDFGPLKSADPDLYLELQAHLKAEPYEPSLQPPKEG